MNTHKLTLVSMFAALTAVGAFIRIPLPYVPITLQVFFVFLAGVLLGPRLGALSQIVYLVLGLIGLPIFAAGGGPGYLFHPTFGFLLGFVAASYVIGLIVYNTEEAGFFKILFASVLGMIILYLVGVPYAYLILNKVTGVKMALIDTSKLMLVFVPGDVLKAVGVAVIAPKVRRVVKINYHN